MLPSRLNLSLTAQVLAGLVSLLLRPLAAAGGGLQTSQCHQRRLSGCVIAPSFRQRQMEARSVLDCLRTLCGSMERDVISFHRPTGQCFSMALNTENLKVLAAFSALFEVADDAEWTTVVRADLRVGVVSRPSGLWMLDHETRGRNFGSKGSRLDWNMTDLVWNVTDHPQSGQRYPQFSSDSRAEAQVLHSGEYLLNLTGPFTVSLWMKREPASNEFLYFFIDDYVNAVREYYVQSENEIFVKVGFQWLFFSLSLTFENWMHVAFVNKNEQHVVYVNGSAQNLRRAYNMTSPVQQPRRLRFGKGLVGSLACYCAYERALTSLEVRLVKEACP